MSHPTTTHPFAGVFPLLDDARLRELADDVRKHGLREPVILYQGQVLDGRNRLRACELAGVSPRFEDFEGDDADALAAVVSLNLHRRHLTESQRAMVAARLLPLHEEDAARRRASGLTQNRGTVRADLPERVEPAPRPRERVAEVLNVSPRSVQSAKAVVERAAPEVVAAVDAGEMPVSVAAEAARLEPEVQREIVDTVRAGATPAEALRQAKAPHVAHNTGNNEWYTPAEYIDAARRAMGGLDLDPASCEVANAVVKAPRYLTAQDDGLAHEWSGKVWMNPPYAAGLVDRFADKLRAEVEAGRVSAAVVLVNNATETRWFATLSGVASALCLPTARVRFRRPDGSTGAPLQGQAVLYIGGEPEAFAREFSAFGKVWHGLR